MDFFGFIVKVFIPYARMVVIFHSERKNDDMVASGSGSVSRKMGRFSKKGMFDKAALPPLGCGPFYVPTA
jgi:hypothetical protein